TTRGPVASRNSPPPIPAASAATSPDANLASTLRLASLPRLHPAESDALQPFQRRLQPVPRADPQVLRPVPEASAADHLELPARFRDRIAPHRVPVRLRVERVQAPLPD